MPDLKISALPTDVVTLADGDKFAIADASALTIDTYATALEIKTHGNTAPVFAAGTASANTHPKLTAGTLLTTPEAGALELDATNLYGCTDAGNRGVIPVVHLIRANVTRTLPNDVNTNAIFNDPANGALTLEAGVYFFEMLMIITAMSATSGNCQVLFGGTATVGGWLWVLSGLDNSTPSSGVADLSVYAATSGSGASFVTAGTGTAARMFWKGTFEVTVAGTFIPQVDLVTAAAAIVSQGTYFRCERIGPAGLVSVGQWS